jgi:putative transposase
MKTIANELYHAYNQGNNREQLFYSDADYIHFLSLYRKLVLPYCETLAYCLMPNHFHFLIYSTQLSVAEVKLGLLQSQYLANGFRLLQTQYTQYYLNPKQQRTGSLFRQKAKLKSVSQGQGNYGLTVFNYIHQNPVAAGIAAAMESWSFSSYQDYAELRNGTLCNRPLAAQLLDFDLR